MANTEITGYGSCPLHAARTEISRTELFAFSDDEQTKETEVCLDCGFTQEISFFSTNSTTSFDHSITKEYSQVPKEKAVLAIIATNAQISPEQFQALQGALNQEVEMDYDYNKTYTDKKPSINERITKRVVLKDVNFVRDPETAKTYLALIKTGADDTYYPFWGSINNFRDLTEVRINSLRLPSGKELWNFDLPGDKVIPNRRAYRGYRHIIQAIKDYSESMRALEKS